jgi:hypothetical protein
MNSFQETLILAIFASMAAVFTYLFVRRTFFIKEETQEATQWYNKKIGWQVRKSDLDETSDYIRKSSKLFGFLALLSWLILIALLKFRY